MSYSHRLEIVSCKLRLSICTWKLCKIIQSLAQALNSTYKCTLFRVHRDTSGIHTMCERSHGVRWPSTSTLPQDSFTLVCKPMDVSIEILISSSHDTCFGFPLTSSRYIERSHNHYSHSQRNHSFKVWRREGVLADMISVCVMSFAPAVVYSCLESPDSCPFFAIT